MKLIIGLGNPGKQYEKTRHNIGFEILDEIQKKLEFPDFNVNEKFNAEISEKNILGEKVILVKPLSFMNRSGEVAQKIISFYKIELNDISIIHDDLDINLGEIKKATDSSAAGHNGVQSIFDSLGTQQITRYKVGIEGSERKKERKVAGDVFVLQKFTSDENEILKKANFSQWISDDLKI